MGSSKAIPAARGVYLGTASRVITPSAGSDLSGFGARTEPMAGVHDELYAKAMVWADDADLANAAALVTLDVLDLDASAVAAIRAHVEALAGIPGERVGVTCTHTHGGPATLPGSGLGRCEIGYLEGLCRIAAEAVAAAARGIEPVVMTAATGRETTVGKNRRVPGGVIDPAVPVLRFQRHDGTVAALLVSHACHPVMLGPDNLLATADYPGYVRRTLEAVYPGAAAQFATGCCGQIDDRPHGRGQPGQGLHIRSFGEAERAGRAIAGAAVQAVEQAAKLDAAMPFAEVRIEPVPVRSARRAVRLPLLTTAEDPAATFDAEVMVIAIGGVSLVLLPGEMFVEFGLEIKKRAESRQVVTLAYANGRPGYIPHRSAYAAGGYEVDEAHRYYGYSACFAPEAGERLVETAIEVLASMGTTAGSAKEEAA